MGSVASVNGGPRIWLEDEVKVAKVRRFEKGAGRTGKGIFHFFEVDPHNGRPGRYRAIDLEDIIAVNRGKVLGRP
jgi:hypothetical protein